MAHQIFNERFYSLRMPAWHGLGTVSEEEKSAVEVFSSINPYIVSLEPMFTEFNGTKYETGYRSIMRHPLPDDPEPVVLGMVGPEYKLVDPYRTCEIFDEAIQQPVETLGVLGRGETLFMTTKLPNFDIKGDPIETYLLLASPYSGGQAIQCRVTPVRVVCQNTLIASASRSLDQFKVIHDQAVEDRLLKWLSGSIERAKEKAIGLRDDFTLMANTPATSEMIDTILANVYVDPTQPLPTPDPDLNIRRQETYEYNLDWAKKARQAVKECFEGKGLGMDVTAAFGTLWGLYNAVVEIEDYKTTTKPASRAESALFGQRASYKVAAYDTILNYVNP